MQLAVQDFTNFRPERSLMSFDVPQRVVASYVVDVPFGKGKHFLGNFTGVADKLVSGWSIQGVTTFQSGYPLVFIYALPTALSQNFGAGKPRLNVIGGCSKSIDGSPTSKIVKWFNANCFAAPSNYGFGNEGRTDPNLRGQGIANFDFSLAKNAGNTFGVVTSQNNAPRQIQLGMRLRF